MTKRWWMMWVRCIQALRKLTRIHLKTMTWEELPWYYYPLSLEISLVVVVLAVRRRRTTMMMAIPLPDYSHCKCPVWPNTT